MQEPSSATSQASLSKIDQERRRSPRYPVRLQAFAELPDLAGKLDCLVLNFCREGMFLKLSSIPKSGVGSKLTVAISTDGKTVHRLPAQLVRITDIGIGVKFDRSIPPALFESLLAKTLPSNQPTLPNSSQLSEFTLSQGKEVLRTTVWNFLPQLEQRFLEAAESAKSNAAQTALFEASHTLQRHRDQLTTELETCFLEKARAYFSFADEPKKSKPADRLSLIDQSDFEDWLNLTETAARIEADYQDKLHLLRYLFARACRHGNDSVPPPILPTAQCECLRSALDRIGIEDTAARKVVYQAFADALYPNFRQMLANFEHVFQIDLSQPLGVGPGQPVQAIDSRTKTTERGSKASPEANQQGSTLPKPGVFQSFYQLANANQGVAADQSFTDFRLLADLLSSLDGTAERWQHGDLAEKLLETIESPLLSDPKARTQLETTCRFIDAWAAEALPTDVALPAELIARLKVPLLRLALLQPELLETEDSPAAELMNQISMAQRLVRKDPTLGKALEDFTQALAKELLTGQGEMRATLQRANTKLHELLAPVLQRRQRYRQHLIDGFEGRQKIAQSKLAVYEALRERLSGQPVPDLIVTLLEAGWYHLLVLSHVRHGQDSPQWQSRIEVLDRLLKWLAADPETRLPPTEVNTLINQLDLDLGVVCNDAIRHRRVIQDLSACLTGPRQGEMRQGLTRNPVDFKRFIEPQLLARCQVPDDHKVVYGTDGDGYGTSLSWPAWALWR